MHFGILSLIPFLETTIFGYIFYPTEVTKTNKWQMNLRINISGRLGRDMIAIATVAMRPPLPTRNFDQGLLCIFS